MEKRPFSEFGLSGELTHAIDALGFEMASPIQSATIPLLLAGRDLVGQSPTGSGKTAAFGIPVIEHVDPEVRAVQAIVLCPTRELAVQVAGELHKLAAFRRGLHVIPVYGGAPFHRQAEGLARGAQVVIGTPGRVLDHLRRGTLDLGLVRTAVLDEADEMLDMGFREDIEAILEATPVGRQTVFFSATMPSAIRELIARFARDPETITADDENVAAPDIEQVWFEVRFRSKPEVLSRLLDLHDARLSIVFCNTKRTVDELTDNLTARGYAADRLHGDMNQMMRTRVMKNFRSGAVEILVATDVAARGLDVDDVDLVFNYDLPFDAEDYVHRIGRTGRAGRSGKAITFVAGRDVYKLQNIQRHTSQPITRARVPTLDELEERRHDLFYDRLRGLLEDGAFPRQPRVIDRLLEQGFAPTEITAAALHLLQESETRPVEPIAEDRPPRAEQRRPPRDGGDRPRREEDRGERPARPGLLRPTAGGASGTARLFANIGRSAKVAPGDLAGILYNVGGLPQGSVGRITLFPKHSLIDVPAEFIDELLVRLVDVRVRGKDVRFDRDRSAPGDADADARPAPAHLRGKPDRPGKPTRSRDDRDDHAPYGAAHPFRRFAGPKGKGKGKAGGRLKPHGKGKKKSRS